MIVGHSLPKKFAFIGLFALVLGVGWGNAASWNKGDLFVAVNGGGFRVYSNDGTFKETFSADTLYRFGCAFNNEQSMLLSGRYTYGPIYVTGFDVKVPHNLTLQSNLGSYSYNYDAGGIAFNNNDEFFVSTGTHVFKFNGTGALLSMYSPNVEKFNGGWIDLSVDQSILFYTSGGTRILRYNVSKRTQFDDFALLPEENKTTVAYGLRLLPPGDGTGGLLVATYNNIKRLHGNGSIAMTYDVPDEDSWYTINLDPNGVSFWAANYDSGNFYKFNIKTGDIEVGKINVEGAKIYGFCVLDEIVAANMSVSSPLNATVVHSPMPTASPTDQMTPSPINQMNPSPIDQMTPSPTLESTPAPPISQGPIITTTKNPITAQQIRKWLNQNPLKPNRKPTTNGQSHSHKKHKRRPLRHKMNSRSRKGKRSQFNNHMSSIFNPNPTQTQRRKHNNGNNEIFHVKKGSH